MHDVYDPFSPVQGQQRLRAAGDPLLPLPISSDLPQELTIASRHGILRRFASSHQRLLFSESRTICRCLSKSNLLNYLRYSPLAGVQTGRAGVDFLRPVTKSAQRQQNQALTLRVT